MSSLQKCQIASFWPFATSKLPLEQLFYVLTYVLQENLNYMCLKMEKDVVRPFPNRRTNEAK